MGREALTLAVVGGAGDRRRFFANAVRGFLGLGRAADVPAWARPERGPVGDDGETMVWTQTRAALAVLATTSVLPALAMRTAEPARLAAEVVARERRRWSASLADPRWQVGPPLVPQAQEEVVLCLLLRRPQTLEAAVAALRLLPRFRTRDENQLRNIADWAHHLYPGLTPPGPPGSTRPRACCTAPCSPPRSTRPCRACSTRSTCPAPRRPTRAS